MTKNKGHQWNKEEIKRLITLWETKNAAELAEEMNLSIPQVMYMANQIRKEGYKLPKHNKIGEVRNLIKEVISELR